MQFLGKEIKFVATRGFDSEHGGIVTMMYVQMAMEVLATHLVDMLVFEMDGDDHMQVRLAGYDFNTEELDESTVALKFASLPIKTFWLKVNDYGEHFVGTFLFPEEY